MAGSMERWVGKTAIVTGASAGIGSEITKILVEAGVKVVGAARRKEKLDELKNSLQGKKGQLYTFSADMTKEEDILSLFKWTKENVGPIHILVNNAGTFRHTTLSEGKTEFWRETLDTNVIGLCIATREAVQDMLANKVDGHIVHINSLAGHRIGNFANTNVYPASKFAVTALTETLRNELNSLKSKIKVSSISPGLVKTEIFNSSAVSSGLKEFPEHLQKLLDYYPRLNPEDVAESVKFVLATPPHVQVHEMILLPVNGP